MTALSKADPFSRNHLIRDGISQALYDVMKEDPAIVLFGEGAWVKQHYDAPKILGEFADRIVTMPICEDGSINFCVGASLLGVKPVYDVITADFLYRCFDSIANTAAKLNFVQAEGEPPKTIVIRAEFLLGGPTTGQRPEALFTHIPGLNVVLPSTPRDAYGLMRTALKTPGVTLFFEDRMIQDAGIKSWDVLKLDALPLCRAVRRIVADKPQLTIVTYGLMRQVVEDVLGREGITGVDLLDLATLYPLDMQRILGHVASSRKLLIVEPDVAYGGIGAEIAAQVAEKLPGTAIRRLGAPRETIPASREGQARMLPTEAQILEAIRGLL